ncbi:hypothetical protein HC891_15130 [Candidatus Gracilibacteria bacterium]|nr:hypothetical protein [Candidatus Gracilibacteria bacterium]
MSAGDQREVDTLGIDSGCANRERADWVRALHIAVVADGQQLDAVALASRRVLQAHHQRQRHRLFIRAVGLELALRQIDQRQVALQHPVCAWLARAGLRTPAVEQGQAIGDRQRRRQHRGGGDTLAEAQRQRDAQLIAFALFQRQQAQLDRAQIAPGRRVCPAECGGEGFTHRQPL